MKEEIEQPLIQYRLINASFNADSSRNIKGFLLGLGIISLITICGLSGSHPNIAIIVSLLVIGCGGFMERRKKLGDDFCL
ncbi:MAG: hypothetical protein ABJA66_08240 [Actinomycetota bacterium]